MLCLHAWRCVRVWGAGRRRGLWRGSRWPVCAWLCLRVWPVCSCCVCVCGRCGGVHGPARCGELCRVCGFWGVCGVCGRACGPVWAVWPCVWPAVCARRKGGPWRAPSFVVCRRRCPTLPHPGGCSTIGAGSLSFRVRKGKRSGRVPAAVAAATLAGPDHAPALDGGRVWDSGIA